MKKIRVLYGLASLFSLLAGFSIYLLFRDLNNFLLFEFIPKPGFAGAILVPLEPSVFSYFLKYNLPDALWFISIILFFRFLWFCNTKMQRKYVFCAYGMGIIFEASQLSQKIPGTFDWLDLLFMGLGAFAESLVYNVFVKRRLV